MHHLWIQQSGLAWVLEKQILEVEEGHKKDQMDVLIVQTVVLVLLLSDIQRNSQQHLHSQEQMIVLQQHLDITLTNSTQQVVLLYHNKKIE